MWTKVNVGFNVEDETANFGTRACAVNDVAVYETNTLAEVHAGEKPSHVPKVDGQFFPHIGLCIAIDSSFTVLSEDYSTIKSVITFQSNIEAFTFTPCGSFALIALYGELKCFHIPSQGSEVFTRTVLPHSECVQFNSVNCHEEDDHIIIIVVLTNGRVMRTQAIDFVEIHKSLLCHDKTTCESLIQNVAFEEIFRMKKPKSKVNLKLDLLKDREVVIFGSAEELCMLNMEDGYEDICVMVDDYKIISIGGVLNESVLFALCESGMVLQICLHTMTSFYAWTKYPVKDFIVLDSSLLLLVEEPLRGLALTLLSWPDFEIKYRIPVGDFTVLIPQKGAEDPLFFEGFGNEEIDTIRIKAIIESQPDLRLDRILRRCKFKEAEKFAKAFSLDLDIVYKAHVQKLSEDLDPWNPPKDDPKEIFNTILELIKKIKDHHFVAIFISRATPPDFDMLNTMLMYGMERFSKVTDKKCADLSDLLAKVSTVARRLDTCMLIYGSATTVNHWIQFPQTDLVVSCLNHLKRGETKESILIWSRHLSDIKSLLNEDTAILSLEGVSKAIPVEELMLWLHHFVPPVLAQSPSVLASVVDWTIHRARALEILDRDTWPNSGLSLAKCLLQLVHTPQLEKSVLLQSHRVNIWNENLSHQSPLCSLIKFIDNLQDIKTLKEIYGVTIPFDQFVQEDHGSFIVTLLESLPLDKIDLFMAEFYNQLMSERQLDPDLQILQFIQDIVMNCEDWWFWDEAPWEARVLALIPHISSVEVKLDAILHVLKSAPVPWSAVVSQLADQGLLFPHAKAKDIRNECKEVPKRLLMKKYDILIDCKHVIQLAQLIVKRNQSSMLEDINILIKCTEADVTEIYLRVIVQLLSVGEEHLVQQVFKSISEGCREECIYHLLQHINRMMLLKYPWDKVSRFLNCMPALKLSESSAFFSELKNIHCLKVEFAISTTHNKMCNPLERQSILETYASKVASELLSDKCNPFVGVKRMTRLAHLLHLTTEEGIVSLANHCVPTSLPIALSVSSNIEDLEMKPDRVYNKLNQLMCLLITYYKPVESDNDLIEMFSSVVQQISRRFQAHAPDAYAENISRWINMFHCTFGITKSMMGLYREPAYNAATAIMVHTSAKIVIYSHVRDAASEFPKEMVNAAKTSLVEINTEIRELWQRLKEEQLDLSCIKLVYQYCWAHKSMDITFKEDTTIDNFLAQCIKDLLRKLFRLRNLDIDLALSLLYFFSRDEAIKLLVDEAQSVGFNYQRLGSISQLALTYSSLNKIEKYTKSFRKYHISCKWAKKLSELGLPYKDAFKDSESDLKQLLLKLIMLPSTTISLLKEFCMDMHFDLQECLMLYLEYLLLNWEPDLDISVSSAGEKVMAVKNSSDDLLHQCKAILHQLKSPAGRTVPWSESIQNELCNLWNKVNCYYYEVYFVLSTLYQQVLSQQSVVKQITGYQSVLQFLHAYTRISSPSETEQEQWFQLFPNKNQLPQISNFRLPFTPFFAKESPWVILKPELSLKTYKTWFKIIPQLGLDRDMLCTLTIQRLSNDQLSGGYQSRGKSLWHLQSCNSSVLQEIQECVHNIHNQEMASAALYYVVNHMPPGADQMAAATLCYLQAEQWLVQDKSEKAKAGFAKVEKKYLTVCTSHILHSSGLGTQEYLQLVLHPQELIVALYKDPSILQRRTGTLTHCPDINSVVLAIGKLHNVNVLGVQQELLSEWLYPSDHMPLDMSSDDITQNLVAIHSNPLATNDNHNIIRACYVLESMDMETAARYLVSYAGVREDLECRPTSVRLRALQCLCSVATPDTVMSVTGSDINTIKKNMRHLMFISELEKLGLVWSTKGFESCDKEDVVRILLLKRTPHAVQLAAAMGCDFNLTNVEYWDQILQFLTSFSMVDELVVLLPELTSISHSLNNTVFTNAWNCALITPFQKAECPVGEETRHRLQSCLELLYCCPVPRQLSLALLVQQCERLHCPQWISRLQPFLDLSQPQPSSTSHDLPQPHVHIKQELSL